MKQKTINRIITIGVIIGLLSAILTYDLYKTKPVTEPPPIKRTEVTGLWTTYRLPAQQPMIIDGKITIPENVAFHWPTGELPDEPRSLASLKYRQSEAATNLYEETYTITHWDQNLTTDVVWKRIGSDFYLWSKFYSRLPPKMTTQYWEFRNKSNVVIQGFGIL